MNTMALPLLAALLFSQGIAATNIPSSASMAHQKYSRISDYNTVGGKLFYSPINNIQRSPNSTSYPLQSNNVGVFSSSSPERSFNCVTYKTETATNKAVEEKSTTKNECNELKQFFCEHYIRKILDILMRTSELIVNIRQSRDLLTFTRDKLNKPITPSINETSCNLQEIKNISCPHQKALHNKMASPFHLMISEKDAKVKEKNIYKKSGSLLKHEQNRYEPISNEIPTKEHSNKIIVPTNTFDLSYHYTDDSNLSDDRNFYLNEYNESCNHLQIPKPILGIPLSQRAQLLLKSHGKIQDSVPLPNWTSKISESVDKPLEILKELNDEALPYSLEHDQNITILNNCKNKSDAFIISPYEFVGKYSDYQDYLIKTKKNASNNAYFCLPPNNVLVPYELFMESCKCQTIHNSDQKLLNWNITSEAGTSDKVNSSTIEQYRLNCESNTPSSAEEESIEQYETHERHFEVYAPIPSQTLLYTQDMNCVHFGEKLKNEALDLRTMESYMYPPIHYILVFPPTFFPVKSNYYTLVPSYTDFQY